MTPNIPRIAYVATLSLIGLVLLSTSVAAQSVKVEGIIKARNGDTADVGLPEAHSPAD